MTEIIIIAVHSVVIVALLATSLIVLSKYKIRLKEAKALRTLLAVEVLLDIQDSLDKFNENYDVQLSLGLSNENGERRFCIKFTDPKDENSNEDPQTEQPSEE